MVETYKLNNGVKIPKLGIGTFLMQPDDAQKAVEEVFSDDYRCSGYC